MVVCNVVCANMCMHSCDCAPIVSDMPHVVCAVSFKCLSSLLLLLSCQNCVRWLQSQPIHFTHTTSRRRISHNFIIIGSTWALFVSTNHF